MITGRLPTFKIGHRSTCVYCGDPASGRDHLIAISYQTAKSAREGRRAPKEDYGPMAWACTSCNSRLNNRWFDSFDARCQWIRDRLEMRTEPVIWTTWEMAKLDHKLRDFVKRETAKRKWMRNRADWYGSRDYLLAIEPLTWEPSCDPYSPKAHPFLVHYFHDTLNLIRLLTSRK